MAALGGAGELSEGQLVDIRKAAELTALAEQARAKAMREGVTGAGDLTEMIRIENLAARAVRTLNLPRAPGPKRKSLAEYLAGKATGDAA